MEGRGENGEGKRGETLNVFFGRGGEDRRET